MGNLGAEDIFHNGGVGQAHGHWPSPAPEGEDIGKSNHQFKSLKPYQLDLYHLSVPDRYRNAPDCYNPAPTSGTYNPGLGLTRLEN